MRILHLIASLDPHYGGTTEAVRVIVSHAPEGCEVEVVSMDDPAAPFLAELDFPVRGMGPVASVYSYSARLAPWLKANRDRFDGVVVHGMWQHCGRSVWRNMGGRVPYAVFPHGMLDPYFKRAFPAKHLKKLLYWLAVEYWVLRGADRVLFTCEVEGELAKQSFWPHRWTPCVVPSGRHFSPRVGRRGTGGFCCFWGASIPRRGATCWWMRL
jgi:hypothetical protein